MEFVTLVGTQVMAVINPFLALKKELNHVFLLHTDFTQQSAEKIHKFIVKSGFGKKRITLAAVSSGVVPNATGRLPAHIQVSELLQAHSEAVFNLAGGMNFQIAACIAALPRPVGRLVYPDSTGIHMFQRQGHQVELIHSYPLPPAVDVLEVQGIAYERLYSEGLSQHIRAFVSRFNPHIVRFQADIKIDNVVFDLIFNYGNTLCFIKEIMYDENTGNGLEVARSLINFAAQRESMGQLYHRRIVALTNSPYLAERLTEESNRKMEVHARHPIEPLNPGSFYVPSVSIKRQGRGAFSLPNTHGARALLVILGRDMMPTLTAIYTHRPEHLILIYSPDDPQISRTRDCLGANQHLLPVKRTSLIATDAIGMDILDVPRPHETQVAVNITPGTKSQTVFLALWAGMHSAGIFSIDGHHIAELPTGTTMPCRYPTVLNLLSLNGISTDDAGYTKETLLQNAENYEAMLTFLRLLLEVPAEIEGFPAKQIDADRFTWTPGLNQSGQITKGEVFFKDSGQRTQWAMHQAGWIEELVGYVMAACHADDVVVRLKIPWSDALQSDILQKHQFRGHRTEMDVAALYLGSYYMISCKQSKGQSGYVTNEAIAMASILGRYAIPLVCVLKYQGEPNNQSNGVYKFGLKTLVDPVAMQNLLNQAHQVRRTTRPTAA